MKTDLYRAQLQQLKEKAQDFAAKYPALAPHLNGTSSDPDVERILQGTAFLSAGIQQRLDSGFPEFAQSVLRLLAPDYVRDIPAATVFEFSPKETLNSPVTISAGARVESADGVVFRSCSDIEVLPLTVERCQLRNQGQHSLIELTIANSSRAKTDIFSDRLRFHLAGDFAHASQLYYLLSQALEKITLCDDGQGAVAQEGERTIARENLTSLAGNDELALLKRNDTTLHGYAQLQEYFSNPHSRLFFDLTGLSKACNPAVNTSGQNKPLPKRFTLRFYLQGQHSDVQVDNHSMRLFCCPAVNLFQCDSEPMNLDHQRSELALNAQSRNRNGNQQKPLVVHKVLELAGQSRRSQGKQSYCDFAQAQLSQQNHNAVYELISRQNSEDDFDSIIRLSFPADQPLPNNEILRAQLLCSNGRYGQQLKVGEISHASADIPDLLSVSNITASSHYLPAPTQGGSLWQLLAHLTVNYQQLTELDNLRSLLNLYNPAQDNHANRKRIDSLLSVERQHSQRLLRGYLIEGLQVNIEVDGSGFVGFGDVYLFGELIFQLLQQFTPLNSFIDVSINANNQQHIWQAKL